MGERDVFCPFFRRKEEGYGNWGGERRQLRNEGVQHCHINFGREMNI
jgi:hypothetical protein